MLTYEDCVGCCDLSEDEIQAIAEHEHVPAIVALEIGETMLEQPGGLKKLRNFIVDDVERSRKRGDTVRTKFFERTLRKFDRAHARDLH